MLSAYWLDFQVMRGRTQRTRLVRISPSAEFTMKFMKERQLFFHP